MPGPVSDGGTGAIFLREGRKKNAKWAIRVSFPSISQFSVQRMQVQRVHAFVCILVTRSPEMSQPWEHVERARGREKGGEWRSQTSFTLWIGVEIPIPARKFLPARAISHWENTPPSAAADTTANYHDGDAAKLLKFMSRVAKMDVVTALMAIWRALRNCLIHFLFLWSHSPLRSAGTRGQEEGWRRGGEWEAGLQSS